MNKHTSKNCTNCTKHTLKVYKNVYIFLLTFSFLNKTSQMFAQNNPLKTRNKYSGLMVTS